MYLHNTYAVINALMFIVLVILYALITALLVIVTGYLCCNAMLVFSVFSYQVTAVMLYLCSLCLLRMLLL